MGTGVHVSSPHHVPKHACVHEVWDGAQQAGLPRPCPSTTAFWVFRLLGELERIDPRVRGGIHCHLALLAAAILH